MTTPNPHASCNKRIAFAWAKYYENVRGSHTIEFRYINRLTEMTAQAEETFPSHIKNELLDMAKELKKQWECPICMDTIIPDNLEITNCGHYYCKPCLTGFKERNKATTGTNGSCPVCRRKFPTG